MITNSVLEKLEFHKILQHISKYCTTELSKKYILNLHPFDSQKEASYEGELVNQAKEILIKQSSPPLEFISDLNPVLSQSTIEGALIDSKKILEILRLAISSRNLFQFFKGNLDSAPQLFQIAGRLFVDKMFEHHIQKIINENGDIKENASGKLAEIRKDINARREELIKSVNRIVKSLSEQDMVREDYLTLRDGRIVIPIKAEHKRHIRGFIHSESSTGQTVYIEPEETLELNNEIVSLSFAEKREIERLLKELTKLIGNVSSQLKDSLNAVSYLDSIFAKAHYSIELIGSFPKIDNSKFILLQDARHPLLLKRMGREGTIPLNVEIKNKKIILITGPNAGGKTVVLKTIGILVLMYQSGIHIPVSPDSNLHFFKNVLLDIGDEQSIEDDLSTFSSHLSNINEIISSADEYSLILLDEIGTGTDPAEGSALATAVLISLRDKASTVFATTHHGSLKLIANELEGFENAAMEFDSVNLKPTYVFKQGIPGSSYAFEVAKRIGFENDFLNLAKEYLDSDKHKVENFLVELETKSRQVEEKLKNVEIENTRLSGLSSLYKQNIEKLNKEKKDILKNARLEADNYLKDINKKFEQVIKGLKESKASSETIKSSQKIINELKEKNKKLFSEELEQEEININLSVGDFASIKNTNTAGEIIEISEEKKKAGLKIGTIKMQVSLNDLIPVKREKIKEPASKHTEYSPIITSPANIRLDIRGERSEEAEFEVIKFIDDAYSGGLDRVEILHGKGTGALKKMVKEVLQNHTGVKEFYFAPIEFGGEGITIVELK